MMGADYVKFHAENEYRNIRKDISQRYNVKIPETTNLPENAYVYGSGISNTLSKRIIAIGTKKGGAGIVAAGSVVGIVNFIKRSFGKKNINVKSIAAIKGTCKELIKFAGNESIVSSYVNTDQNLEFDENVSTFF